MVVTSYLLTGIILQAWPPIPLEFLVAKRRPDADTNELLRECAKGKSCPNWPVGFGRSGWTQQKNTVPRDPITETENGFMEPKYLAFRFGDEGHSNHLTTRWLDP